MLTRTGRTAVGPLRLTDSNYGQYAVERYRVPGLPASIAGVGYAERVSR